MSKKAKPQPPSPRQEDARLVDQTVKYSQIILTAVYRQECLQSDVHGTEFLNSPGKNHMHHPYPMWAIVFGRKSLCAEGCVTFRISTVRFTLSGLGRYEQTLHKM